MKTQILTLEAHDDVVSIRDKLAWKQTGRILLVFPGKRGGGLHRRLNRALDLLLIKRAAERLGAQIAFVTQDDPIQKTAAEIGIPVFKDLNDAHTSRWRVPHQHKPMRMSKRLPFLGRDEINNMRTSLESLFHKRTSPKSISYDITSAPSQTKSSRSIKSIGLTAAILFLGGISWLCTVPRAEIEFSPGFQIQEISLPVKASPQINTVQINGEMPARRFSVVVQSQEHISVTGKMAYAKDKATGYVEFQNLTNHPIRIPHGTQLSTSSHPAIIFLTTTDRDLPAGFSNEKELVPSAITVPIEASLAGPRYNLAAEAVDTVLGPLAPNLKGTNPFSISGGTEETLPCVTAQDKRKLRELSIRQLEEDARAGLEKAVSLTGKDVPGFLLSNPPEIARIIQEEYVPERENIPAYTIELNIKIEYQAWGVSGDDLSQYAAESADAVMPEGFVPAENTLEVSQPSNPQVIETLSEAGTFGWVIGVHRKIIPELQTQAIYQNIALRSPMVGIRILEESLSLEKPPQIRVTPAWLPFLPPLPAQFQFIEDIS